jgi:hypothetical protein
MGVLSYLESPNWNFSRGDTKHGACPAHEIYQDPWADRTGGREIFPIRSVFIASEVDAMDLDEAVLYRMAYGLAFVLAEADKDRFPGRWALNAAAGELPT